MSSLVPFKEHIYDFTNISVLISQGSKFITIFFSLVIVVVKQNILHVEILKNWNVLSKNNAKNLDFKHERHKYVVA